MLRLHYTITFAWVLTICSSTTIDSAYVKGIRPCAAQCFGLVMPTWKETKLYIWTSIDISKCKFISRPIVVAVIQSSRAVRPGGVYNNTIRRGFNYVVFKKEQSNLLQHANTYWKLSWSAAGYVC